MATTDGTDAHQPSTAERTRADRPEVDGNDIRPIAVRALFAYVALTAVATLIGMLVVHVLEPRWVGDIDRAVPEWMARNRTAALDSVTAAVSSWADAWSIVIGTLGSFLMLAAVRAWRSAAVVVVGLLVELAVFVSVSVAVGRSRPPVDQLDVLPPTAGFPSGHVAAAVAVYGGWALVIRRIGRVGWVTSAVTVLAAVAPVAVALARIYRGQHHPLDVLAGGALGLACLAVASAVTRDLPDRLDHRLEDRPDPRRRADTVGPP
jgi:undecaprenyl-diphosphatase